MLSLIPLPIIIIASQPNEFLPGMGGGHDTLPIPLKRTLLTQRGRMESPVAASLKAISSLVSWNQSLTMSIVDDRSASPISWMSAESLLIRLLDCGVRVDQDRSPDTVLIDLAEMHVIPIGAIVGVCAEAVCHVGARRDRVLMIAMAISLVEWGEMV